MPECVITLPPEGELLQPGTLFPAARDGVWMEIGFGGGEHLAAQAAAHPDTGFIGCEPFMDGVAKLLARMEEQNLQNIRIFPEDARALLERLPDACLQKICILFPDPWPKQRHHKRRLINVAMLEQLARTLAQGAQLVLATDHEEYAQWMLLHLLADERFYWTAETPEDFKQPPQGWVVTRYQEKAAKEGRAPCFLIFQRQ